MLPGTQQRLGARTSDQFTKALLHFDGADGSTAIIDSAVPPHSFGSSAVLSTAVKKFGTASLKLAPGTTCQAPHSADWEFGAGDWTIDWFEQLYSGAADGQPTLVRDSGVVYTPFMLGYLQAGIQAFYATSNGSSWDLASGHKIGTADFNMHHFAVQRLSGTFYLFDNGVLQTTIAGNAAPIKSSTGSLTLGLWNSTGIYTYVDELRISKGIARFPTGGFTPPSAPYTQ